MKKTIFLFNFCLYFVSCSNGNDENFIYEDEKFIGPISNSDKYCAFTDLVEFNNILYCCFRESDGHVPSSTENYGKIRILQSFNGENWTDAALISDSDYDLRDPKLEVTSDGRLMLLVGCSSFDEKGQFNFRKTKVGFCTGELSELSDLIDLELGEQGKFNNLWLWRSIWNDGVAYLPDNKPVLLKSHDGLKYDEIAQFDLLMSCNEAGISFRSNGNMILVIRDNNSEGYVSESESPYTNWNWSILEQNSQSPAMLTLDDYIFLAIRNVSKQAISLQYIDSNSMRINNLYDQSVSGDMGYPGLVNYNGQIIMSYYQNGQIYIVSFLRKDVFNRINNALNAI